MKLPIDELLSYSLQLSDNNACDILFNLIGGPQKADSIIKRLGYPDIHILNSEFEMNEDYHLCYNNTTTPIEMAKLFDQFYNRGLCQSSDFHKEIGNIMRQCNTGMNRLPAPLSSLPIEIAHKTGTGGFNSNGKIIAVNDAGYVFLNDLSGYSLAVFISDSGYDMGTTEKIIADISSIIFNFIKHNI